MTYDIFYSIIMGLLQGLTEWLPVSSSGHLVLAQHFFNVKERTLFDAILHLGTLLAMTVYFRKDIRPMMNLKNPTTPKIIIASVPIIVIGFVFSDMIENAFSLTILVAVLLVVNGCVLWVNAFLKSKGVQELKNEKNNLDISKKNSITIGLFQVFALLPGISRSGTTITTGRVLGLDWKTAAKFSFFISFLPVAGAAWFKIVTDWQEFQVLYLLGFFIAFIVGYATIDLMMRILGMGKFHYFGVYTIIVGIVMISILL
jgi:undecaprenyl-diphosphatase